MLSCYSRRLKISKVLLIHNSGLTAFHIPYSMQFPLGFYTHNWSIRRGWPTLGRSSLPTSSTISEVILSRECFSQISKNKESSARLPGISGFFSINKSKTNKRTAACRAHALRKQTCCWDLAREVKYPWPVHKKIIIRLHRSNQKQIHELLKSMQDMKENFSHEIGIFLKNSTEHEIEILKRNKKKWRTHQNK